MQKKKYSFNIVLMEIMKKYNIEEGSKINLNLIKEIAENEKIRINDLMCMLQISTDTMYRLRTKKQKYTKVVFDKYKGIKNKRLMKKEIIDYETFIKLKNKMELKPYGLIKRLGISKYSYQKLKQGEVTYVKIKDVRLQHIVDLIKIDFEYLKIDNKGYCKRQELDKLCKERRITLDDFLKYSGKNSKYYKLNRLAIEKCDEGLYIGSTCKIPNDFIERNYKEIMRRLTNIANKVSIILNCKSYKEDLVQEALNKLYEKCGDVVKKFYFDIKLVLNILMVKAKYIMFNILKREYKENKNIHYDELEKDYIDHLSFFRDDTYNPEFLIN